MEMTYHANILHTHSCYFILLMFICPPKERVLFIVLNAVQKQYFRPKPLLHP